MNIKHRQLERMRKLLENMKRDARGDYNEAYEGIFIKYGSYAEHLLGLVEALEYEITNEL